MPSVISQTRIEANRRNARRSTGPRSVEGKTRSARNSVSHGIFAKNLVLPGEDPQVFRRYKLDVVRRLNPRDVVELQFVEQFISASWRLKRAQAAETLLYSARATTLREEHQQDQLAMIDKGEVRDADDPKLQDLPSTIPPEAMMVQMLQDKDDPALDRLHRYERRLEFTMNRCLKQLRQLREEEQTAECPFTQELLWEGEENDECGMMNDEQKKTEIPADQDDADDREIVQNEANDQNAECGIVNDELKKILVPHSAFTVQHSPPGLTIPARRDLLPAAIQAGSTHDV